MAKERMVTRTVEQYALEVTSVDITTKQFYEGTAFVPVSVKPEKWLDFVKKNNTDPNIVFLEVTSHRKISTLYGMTEQDFIKYSKVLPPRSTDETDTTPTDDTETN